MRFLFVFALAVALTPTSTGQVRVHVALSGGYGSGGYAGRTGVSVEREHIVGTVRVSVDGLEADPPSVAGVYQQRNLELAALLGRSLPLSEALGLSVGAGLAYGATEFVEVDDAFLLENTAFTLQLPLEADAVLSLTEHVGLTVGGYWSIGLARLSGGGLADSESTSHRGILAGFRATL